MKNGFIKVAAATPRIRIADPSHNLQELLRLTRQAHGQEAQIVVFPELCLTGATCGDLFFSQTLLQGAKDALNAFLEATKELSTVVILGLPWSLEGQIYNCAALCQNGRLLGIVPKSVSSKSTGEDRVFASAPGTNRVAWIGEQSVPFGASLLFACREITDLILAVEIGTDRELPIPPSANATQAGATLICNPSATPEIIGAAEHRRTALCSLSGRLSCAYLCAEAGAGESTTDVVYGGHRLLAENGKPIAEALPFSREELTVSEIDLERLTYQRRRANLPPSAEGMKSIFSLPLRQTKLTRAIAPHPFIPTNKAACNARCETILNIQAEGLKQRVERVFAKKLVLGISGGLDSTLALLVMVRAMDGLERPRKDILAVTMPCFGTTQRTKNNATVLCEELGVDFRQVDIFDAVNLHFRDIGHDPNVRDVTYENSQARERTQILMDIANDCGGMVIGTGDLSELALGWATYNGDHMSMYAVNADVPKTLIRHVVAYSAEQFAAEGKTAVAEALLDVLGTPVSPELLPADESGSIAQKTEDLVGPYEIHDFYLYYLVRYGFSPEKLYRMAKHALGSIYDNATLLKWLKIFLRRFFSQQFKRSCLPDGPKVGSVGFSPRGDWKMPSDASAALWLAEAEALDANESATK